MTRIAASSSNPRLLVDDWNAWAVPWKVVVTVLGSTFNSAIIDFRLAGSLVASAGATGIFLLWLLDVKVYHRLLVAVFSAAKDLEGKLDPPLNVRTLEKRGWSRDMR